MPKFQISPAFIAAAHVHRATAASIPLYLPADNERELLLAPRREADGDDDVVDASGITIGADEDDDDFY